MSSISVKSYLFPLNVKVRVGDLSKGDEIRRFNLQLNNTDNMYNTLMDKIRTVYSNLLSKGDEVELKTYWLDDENELVGFSSDSEMQYSIDIQNAIRQSQPNKPSSNLFKVYISRQMKKEETNADLSPEVEVHPGVLCDGCNGEIAGKRRKCAQCPDYDLCEKCSEKGLHQENGHSFIVFDKPVKRQCPYLMNGGQRRRGGFKHCKRQHPKCDFENNVGPLKEMFGNIGPLISSSLPRVSNPDHLKSVGEFLKSLLDPFGIDCDFKVESKDKQTPPGEKSEESAKTSSESEKVNEEKKMETGEDDVEKEDENVGIRVFATPLVEESVQTNPFEAAANALKKAMINNAEEIEKTDEVKPSSSSTTTTTTTAESNQVRRQSDSNLDDFNLVDVQKEIQIINAIEQLKCMGYSDDGGWLTRLASAKQGNINAVLDAIAPSK